MAIPLGSGVQKAPKFNFRHPLFENRLGIDINPLSYVPCRSHETDLKWRFDLTDIMEDG
jgi:hypothetical protein